MAIQNLTDVVAVSLQRVWETAMGFIPSLVGALVVFVLGLVIASGLGTLVEKVFDALRLDHFLTKMGLAPHFERGGMKLQASKFLGQLVNWFLILVFLLAASDILGLYALSAFLRDVLNYVPNVIAAILIMLAAFVVGSLLRRIVSASVMSAQLHAARFLGSLTWWTVILFGFFAALVQLNVAATIVNNIVMGFIGMIALAGGLAFGLGGKEYAAHLIGKLREHTE